MDDENLEQTPQDDDLLDWEPPELTQRALYAAQKDAGLFRPKPKKLDFKSPPAGKHRTLSLVLLLCGALFLVLGTALAATGANGQQAVLEKGRLGYALWMSGQAAVLCTYLLYLLPLGRDTRRPVLLTVLAGGLLFSFGAALIAALPKNSGLPPGGAIATLLVAVLLTSNLWLLIGLLRRKTSERLAGVMGCATVFLGLLGLAGALLLPETATAPAGVTALEVLQIGCYTALLFAWPVLDRPVLAVPPQEDSEEELNEGDLNDGQQPE